MVPFRRFLPLSQDGLFVLYGIELRCIHIVPLDFIARRFRSTQAYSCSHKSGCYECHFRITLMRSSADRVKEGARRIARALAPLKGGNLR